MQHVSAYNAMGGVRPLVFGYLAEASAGTCDFIKSLAEEMAPEIADHYLLDSPDAAVGIATDRLREEFGAAAFKAQARIILDRVSHASATACGATVLQRSAEPNNSKGGSAAGPTPSASAARGATTRSGTGAREQSGGGSGGGEAARPGGGAGRTREQLTRRSRARAGGGRGAVGRPATV